MPAIEDETCVRLFRRGQETRAERNVCPTSNGLLIRELLGETRRGRIVPGGEQRGPHGLLRRGGELDLSAAATSPSPLDRLKDVRFGLHERRLLFGRQLDHAPALLRPERREDLSAHPKIRMDHVLVLQRLGKTERDTPEL